jgi:hypothetical protein
VETTAEGSTRSWAGRVHRKRIRLWAVRLELPEDVHKLLRNQAAERDLSFSETARQLAAEPFARWW